MSNFISRYLDPSERMAELLFGLIMTLTFTLGASLVIKEGPDATRELLVGVIGCNIAWGFIDGLLFIFGSMYARGAPYRAQRMLEKKGADFCRQKIHGRMDEEFAGSLSDQTKEQACVEIIQALKSMTLERVRVTRDDIGGALASFWLVFVTAIPAIVPFLFLDNRMLALRVSNGLLVALLYLIGRQWAVFINANRHVVGFGMAFFGLILVQLTILLGG